MRGKTKRIFIIFIYLLLFSAVVGFLYFIFKSDPTCFDGKQNQNERGIDCGGPCRDCAVVIEAQALEVQEKNYIYGGPDMFDVVVKIYNPNEQYGSPEFKYNMKLIDSSGNVLAERSGQEYILPSESKYIIETNLETSSFPANVEVELSNAEWVEFWDYDRPRLSIYKKQFNLISSGTRFAEVKGLLRNESHFDFRVININIVLKDSEGRPLATNKTEIRDVKAKEEREFELPWSESFSGDVQEIEIEAKTNVFDQDNFL